MAEHLLASGDQVMGCCRNGRWRDPETEPLDARVPLLAWDLERDIDPAAREAVAGFRPDCIFHLAAMAIPKECGDGEPTSRAWQVNVEGTRRIAALAASLPTAPRLLLVSSSHVYAPVDPAHPVVDEAAPVGPLQGYGKTKIAAEQVLRDAMKTDGLFAIIARTFNHAGPRQDAQLMVPQWCRQIVAGGEGPIRVYNLDTFLDLSDVRDVVRAYRLLVRHASAGEICNVGSGVCRRSGDLFAQLLDLREDPPPFVEIAPGRQQHSVANIHRLQALTGWLPAIPMPQTLADSLAYWQRQADAR